MKLLIPVTLLLCASTLAIAQSDSSSVREDAKEKFKLIRAQVARNSKDGIRSFEKDVVIEIKGKLRIEADRATFDRKNGVIMTYDTKKFQFDGEVIISKNQKGICRYTLGEGKLHLE
jgi:lipopolysaccharide export system protein LptA